MNCLFWQIGTKQSKRSSWLKVQNEALMRRWHNGLNPCFASFSLHFLPLGYLIRRPYPPMTLPRTSLINIQRSWQYLAPQTRIVMATTERSSIALGTQCVNPLFCPISCPFTIYSGPQIFPSPFPINTTESNYLPWDKHSSVSGLSKGYITKLGVIATEWKTDSNHFKALKDSPKVT